MTNQQSAEGPATNLEPAHSSGDAEALRRAVDDLRTALESKVTVAWAELIEPQGRRLLDSLQQEAHAKRKRAKKSREEAHIEDYREFLEDRVTTVASQLYSLSLRGEALASLPPIIADEISDNLASQVELTAVSHSLRRAIACVLEDACGRLETSSKSVLACLLADLKKKEIKRDRKCKKPVFLRWPIGFYPNSWGTLVKSRWDQFKQWLDSCRDDLEFVCNQGSTVLVPAIMSEFDDHLARLQKVPNDPTPPSPANPKD